MVIVKPRVIKKGFGICHFNNIEDRPHSQNRERESDRRGMKVAVFFKLDATLMWSRASLKMSRIWVLK